MKEKSVVIYGAAATGEIAFRVFKENGVDIRFFIDKRADEIAEFMGKPVYKLNEQVHNANDEIVFIAVKNVFEHDGIVKQLIKQGYRYFIYMPYCMVKGSGGDATDKFLYDAWNNVMKGNMFDLNTVPMKDKLSNYCFEDQATICKIDKNERVVYVPMDILFTDNGARGVNTWADIPVFMLIPHIKFFRWLEDREGGFDAYLDFCIEAAKRRNVVITEAWKENVVRNRANVYVNMNDDLQRNYDFFIKNAPHAIWNNKGYFNLDSGKHRATFLLSKGRRYIPLRISNQDFEKWISQFQCIDIQNYMIKNEQFSMQGPVSHPYFYDMQCDNRETWYKLLVKFAFLLAEDSLKQFNAINMEKMPGVVLAIGDDGFIERALRRFDVKIIEEVISEASTCLWKMEKNTNERCSIEDIKYGIIDTSYINIETLLKKYCNLNRLICILHNGNKTELCHEGWNLMQERFCVLDNKIVNLIWMEK